MFPLETSLMSYHMLSIKLTRSIAPLAISSTIPRRNQDNPGQPVS
jgi:hypothetical protein